jgi:iron complex transport system substrate-binding protein
VKIALRFISAILLLLATAAAAAVSYPLSVTDDLGRLVVLERAPSRVVSMIPSSTEIVCALEACELLVGADQFSNYPAEVNELPRLGSAFSPNIEEIVALEPDLVLVDEDSGLAAKLEAVGLTVYAGTGQTYDELFANFRVLGRLLDRETEAALLAGRVRGEVEAVAELVAELASPTVYFEIDATPYSVGPTSFIGVLIAKAGGRNIVEPGMGEFPQLDPEFVVAADPQVIVLADAPYGESAETVAGRPGWSGLTAVVTERVVELDAEQVDALSRPGPRIGLAVSALARILHPDRF